MKVKLHRIYFNGTLTVAGVHESTFEDSDPDDKTLELWALDHGVAVQRAGEEELFVPWHKVRAVEAYKGSTSFSEEADLKVAAPKPKPAEVVLQQTRPAKKAKKKQKRLFGYK